MIKAVRGAITCEENTALSIAENTKLLLNAVMSANGLQKEQLVHVIFSATADLTAAYPAKFARDLGWTEVPLFCVQEMAVDGSLAMCIRVLITAETDKKMLKPIYLKGAQVLRPDLLATNFKEETNDEL